MDDGIDFSVSMGTSEASTVEVPPPTPTMEAISVVDSSIAMEGMEAGVSAVADSLVNGDSAIQGMVYGDSSVGGYSAGSELSQYYQDLYSQEPEPTWGTLSLTERELFEGGSVIILDNNNHGSDAISKAAQLLVDASKRNMMAGVSKQGSTFAVDNILKGIQLSRLNNGAMPSMLQGPSTSSMLSSLTSTTSSTLSTTPTMSTPISTPLSMGPSMLP